MKSGQESNRTRITVAIVLVAALLLAVVGVGVYGLFFATKKHEPTFSASPTPSYSSNPSPPAVVTVDPESMVESEQFAQWVAEALFAWDTGTMNRTQVIDKLMAVADPSGDGEGPGLASDIGNYLPDNTVWLQLRHYATKQWLEVEAIEVPEAWGQALADAASGQILPGTTAYTITGTRHREGVWEKETTSYSNQVAFTVFVTCAPSFPECHLLRLSQLDNPLR